MYQTDLDKNSMGPGHYQVHLIFNLQEWNLKKFITLWVLSYKFSPSRNRLLPQPAHCLHQSGSATSSSMTLVALVMLCKSFLEKKHPTSKGFVSLYWEHMKEEERCSALTMGVLEELRDLKWRWTTSAKIQWNMFNIKTENTKTAVRDGHRSYFLLDTGSC